MRIPRWQPGRQGTGYRKAELARGRRWDLHVIDYPAGITLPPHVDPVPGRRHLRVNLAVRTGGARLTASDVVARLGERLVLFWSDRTHDVSTTRSRRVVVSLGLALGLLVMLGAPAHANPTSEDAAPPPVKTPFDQGRFGLSVGGGTQSLLGYHYFAIGAGAEYYVLDGVGLGASGLEEFGNGPNISKLSPSLRYVAQPLVGKWPLIPYVGGFYNHWFIAGGNPDLDTLGGRGGLLYVSGQLVLGLGIAVERTISTCVMDCTSTYPDFTIALAF